MINIRSGDTINKKTIAKNPVSRVVKNLFFKFNHYLTGSKPYFLNICLASSDSI